MFVWQVVGQGDECVGGVWVFDQCDIVVEFVQCVGFVCDYGVIWELFWDVFIVQIVGQEMFDWCIMWFVGYQL